MGSFDFYIGIDYSGSNTPTSRLKGLQVYSAPRGGEPTQVGTPAAPLNGHRNWSRKEIFEWLIEQARSPQRFIAGIDHAFSFPASYLDRYGLSNWDDFLEDFCRHWPAHTATIESLRDKNSRTGDRRELRLTEKWTSSAKSVFLFDVPGEVAKSTHAGIPWLFEIRKLAGSVVHFWPFDGWEIPDGKSAIAEVYPSIFRNRYAEKHPTTDQQDAYSVARWLKETDEAGNLGRYLHPPLSKEERQMAEREGWIIGVA